MDEKERKLKFDILRNCEPDMYTPLWETISFIENAYPNSNKDDIIKVGSKTIVDLVNKGFIELYLGSAYSNEEYILINKNEIMSYLDRIEYWHSKLVPEKYIELFLTPLGVDVSIGKTSSVE